MLFIVTVIFLSFFSFVSSLSLHHRQQQPNFPSTPPSCPICEAHWSDSVATCSDAVAAFQDPQQIIFNPAGFIAVIRCGCTDTFQSTFPQCVDCFQATNQTSFLSNNGNADLPSAVSGMRQVCALASSLLGSFSSTASSDSTAASEPTIGETATETVAGTNTFGSTQSVPSTTDSTDSAGTTTANTAQQTGGDLSGKFQNGKVSVLVVMVVVAAAGWTI